MIRSGIQNTNRFADSDLQLVFAHMRNSNYGAAQAAINNLDSTRTDWATLLDFMLDMEQDSMKYYRLFVDTNAVNFLEGYAIEEGRDGQFVAQNILHFILGVEFEEPRTYLESGVGERRRSDEVYKSNLNLKEQKVKIHPNPTKDEFIVSIEKDLITMIEVKDILGKTVLTKNVEGISETTVSLSDFSNGIYFIEVRGKNSAMLLKSKLIKQD
jgi:hypothetical protein